MGLFGDPGVDRDPPDGSSGRRGEPVCLGPLAARMLRCGFEEAPRAALGPTCDVGVSAPALRSGYFVYLVGSHCQKAISDYDSF
jgi:hypothetical protein